MLFNALLKVPILLPILICYILSNFPKQGTVKINKKVCHHRKDLDRKDKNSAINKNPNM